MALNELQKANFRHHTHNSDQVLDPDTGDPISPGGSTSFGTPAITLGTAAVAGVATTAVRTDATLLAFDATDPTTQAFGDAAAAGAATTAARRDHKHAWPALGTTTAAIGTSAGGAAVTPSKSDHVHATGAGTPSTQTFGDSAATGTGPAAAMTDHKHAMPANPVSYAAPALTLGTANSAGAASTLIRTDATILAFDATTPSTQAFSDAGTVGAATVASRRDHKHVMPTLGYGLSGNAAPAVGLTNSSAFATATTSISAATYADVTGVSVTLAAGTWMLFGQATGSSVNAAAILHVALTHSDNTVLSEGSGSISASGTASVAMLCNVSVMAIVTPGTSTVYKMRAARGLTTITGTVVVQDGAGTNTLNNLTDNSDKGTGIFAIRIA